LSLNHEALEAHEGKLTYLL